MNKPLPKCLRDAPILGALIEVRFKSGDGSLAASVLPGLLYSQLKGKYPTIHALPTGQIPAEIKQQNPELCYLPSQSMVREGAAVSIGDSVLGFAVSEKYPGWDKFKAEVLDIWNVVKASEIIRDIERFSIKYTNLIEAPLDDNHLDLTTVNLSLGNHTISSGSTTVRTELTDGRFVTIVNLVTQAITMTEPKKTGLIVELDVICNGPFDGGWDQASTLLEDAHDIEKRVFFELLKDSTINRYGPEY